MLPNSNSNGNPFINYGLLIGICSFDGLNISKECCVSTPFVCSPIAYRPSCVYCCCCYKCCCKFWKCCGFAMASIQFSYTSPSKYRCSSPFGNLVSCSLFFLVLFPQLSLLWRCHMWYLLPLLPWSFLLWRCRMWYLLPILPWLSFLWKCHLWYFYNLSNYMYNCCHYPYHS